MSEQPTQQQSSEPTEPTEQSVSLIQLLKELYQTLIENFKLLYSENSLNTSNLDKSIRHVLTEFCKKKDIKQIDIFAILNSLKKNPPVLFEMNSTGYSFQFFSGETTLTIGNSSNIIKINSNLIIERLEIITISLTTSQKDFIYLMYHGLYKLFIPSQFKGNFDMSVDCPYDFYMKSYRDHGTTWEERRREILPNCKRLIIKLITVSKNTHNYRIQQFKPPESLVMFSHTDYLKQLYNEERLVLRF
jgi:hypothetical protein